MMHWMLYFVIVCKSLKVCWVCIYALPCCSLLSNWHAEKQWCSSLCSGTHLAANLCDEIRLWMYRKMHQEAALGYRSGAGQSHFVSRNVPTCTGQGHYLMDFFFPVDKVRPVFLLGTENHWPVCVYDATLSIPPENIQDMMLWWGLLVPHTCQGHSGDPFAPARESIHISEKLKHVWHLRQSQSCCFGYTAVPVHEWVSVILQCRFSIRLNQFAQAARRQSQTLFQNLPVLPAPFCTNTSISLAKISL